MTERLPKWALYAFIVALPFHNLVMAMLWNAGVRGFALDVVSAWKEVLLALALGAIVWRSRGIPFKATSTDWLALVYTAFVVVYALIPQDWLGGEASTRGILYGFRHDLTPVAAYFLGRGITLTHRDRERIGWLILGVAGVVAAWGLVDIYTISLQTWRNSGVPGWFSEQLGSTAATGSPACPRTGSTTPATNGRCDGSSPPYAPPATGYLLLVALLVAATWRGSRWLAALTALLAVGLFFTYSRTSIAALVFGLAVLAYALRAWWPVAAAAVLLATAFFFVRAYPDIAPETRFTPAELQIQRAGGQQEETSGNPLDPGESSFESHLDSLREGIDTVVEHPYGYGLGNSGVTAKRTGREIKAGESTYTELGVKSACSGCPVHRLERCVGARDAVALPG